MAAMATFTLYSSSGETVAGFVHEKPLRKMYTSGADCLLATQFCSEVGGGKNELSILLPMCLDLVTLEAVRDVLQEFVEHCGKDFDLTDEHKPFQVRLTYEIASGPFLHALDYLQVPIGDGPIFQTVAAKWKHQAISQMEIIGKDLVANFLEPALLGDMSFGSSSKMVVVFQHEAKSVRPHDEYAMYSSTIHDLVKCKKITKHANLVVFGSVQEKRPRSKGAKYYRIYQVANGCFDVLHSQQAPRLQKVLVEKEVQWDDAFDTFVAELFENSFKRNVFRDLISSSHAFKDLSVEVLDDVDALLFSLFE